LVLRRPVAEIEGYPIAFSAPIDLSASTLDLHILLDESSVEVFAQHGTVVMTAQTFGNPHSDGVRLISEGEAPSSTRYTFTRSTALGRTTSKTSGISTKPNSSHGFLPIFSRGGNPTHLVNLLKTALCAFAPRVKLLGKLCSFQ
jgi:hypothetical protein